MRTYFGFENEKKYRQILQEKNHCIDIKYKFKYI